MSFDTTYFKALTDCYTATVTKAGDVEGQYIVQPHTVEADAQNTPEMPALAADAIKPSIGDKVLCVTSRNDYDHNYVNRFNRTTGGNIIIVGVFSNVLTRDAIFNITKDLNVGGDCAIDGDTSIGGDGSIEGDLSVAKDLSVDGNANVTGNATITGNVTAMGSISAPAVSVAGVDFSTFYSAFLALQSAFNAHLLLYQAHTHLYLPGPGAPTPTAPPT